MVSGTMKHSPSTPLDQTHPINDVGHYHLYEAGGWTTEPGYADFGLWGNSWNPKLLQRHEP